MVPLSLCMKGKLMLLGPAHFCQELVLLLWYLNNHPGAMDSDPSFQCSHSHQMIRCKNLLLMPFQLSGQTLPFRMCRISFQNTKNKLILCAQCIDSPSFQFVTLDLAVQIFPSASPNTKEVFFVEELLQQEEDGPWQKYINNNSFVHVISLTTRIVNVLHYWHFVSMCNIGGLIARPITSAFQGTLVFIHIR